MSEPLVTIYCLAYNHEKYIRDMLDGLLMQETDFPYEIIVHDDASTDGTASIIREYEKKYPYFSNQYIRKKTSIPKE
jgi:Glycosyltransferases involved in cell wall biogenesis